MCLLLLLANDSDEKNKLGENSDKKKKNQKLTNKKIINKLIKWI